MTVVITRDKGSITISCNDGDDFISAYLELVNQNVMTCNSCGSQQLSQTFYPISKELIYKCHTCNKTWKMKKMME